MILELDLARIQKWSSHLNEQIPPHVRDQVRYEIDIDNYRVTLYECRPPWREDFGSEWTKHAICRFRYTKKRAEWSLYRRDQHQKYHLYDYQNFKPTPHLENLIKEVETDPTAIFWG